MIKIYAQRIKQAWCFSGFITFYLFPPLALTAVGKFHNRATAWLTTTRSFKDPRARKCFPANSALIGLHG